MASEKDLAAFANAAGQINQPQPGGHALVRPTTGIGDRVIGAQPVAVHRDETKVLQKLKALAAAAGNDWFYRFPVKNNRTGSTDYIEGPSIKLANDVARIFGNCAIEIRELDVGDAFVFYARFTDIETGFSMERAYRQRKSQTSMKTRDVDRSLDIVYSIGQSKAIRNVICNALQVYADYAFEEARNSLVEKIGKDLPGWRERTVKGLAKLSVSIERVERVVGRPAKEWLAPDIAQVIAMARSITDGMATVDEVFPPPQEVQPPSKDESPSKMAAKADQETSDRDSPSSDPPDSSVGEPAPEHDQQQAPTGETSPDPVDIAYDRGTKAKAAGSGERALPGDYRDPKRTAEALAWTAGVKGQPKPGRG